MSIEWYAVHTYIGQEERVQQHLEERARRLGMWKNKIFQVVQPTEETVELVGGGRKETVVRPLFPGYVFVQMDIEDDDAPDELGESWELVRNTNGVTGFVGTSTRPVPLSPDEVRRLLESLGFGGGKKAEAPRPQIDLRPGDVVHIIEGPFKDFDGIVNEVNIPQSKVRLLVSIFGRETPVEVDFAEISK